MLKMMRPFRMWWVTGINLENQINISLKISGKKLSGFDYSDNQNFLKTIEYRKNPASHMRCSIILQFKFSLFY